MSSITRGGAPTRGGTTGASIPTPSAGPPKTRWGDIEEANSWRRSGLKRTEGTIRRSRRFETDCDRRTSRGGPLEGGASARVLGGPKHTPLKCPRLERSRVVMLFPLPAELSEAEVESSARDLAIDLGQSPPVAFKFCDIAERTWDCVAETVQSRYLPFFHEVCRSKTQAAPNAGVTSVRVCFTVFSSVDAATSFAANRHKIEVISQPATIELKMHIVAAAPVDLFPLSRVTSHPAFLDFPFEPSRLEGVYLRRCTELTDSVRQLDRRTPTIWGLTLSSPLFIHQRRGPDRKARPLFTTPLSWKCVACDHINTCSDTCWFCTNCGCVRTVFSPLQVNCPACPPEMESLMRRPSPMIREFILLQNACGLHNHPEEELYLLPDEATDRDSYAFFTRDGLFYTLDIPTGDLILTHVIAVEQEFQSVNGSGSGKEGGSSSANGGSPSAPMKSGNALVGTSAVSEQQAQKAKAEDKQRLANATLVASVLAQAQRVAAQVQPKKAAAKVAVVVPTKLEERSALLKVAVAKQPVAPVVKLAPERVRQEWRNMNANEQKIEVNTGVSINIVDPARKPSIRELRIHQTNQLQEEQSGDLPVKDKVNEPLQEDLICFVCLRQFDSVEHLKRHEEVSSLHKSNVVTATADKSEWFAV